MTVAMLIAALSEYPPDTLVEVETKIRGKVTHVAADLFIPEDDKNPLVIGPLEEEGNGKGKKGQR